MIPPADLRPYIEELERFADGQMSNDEQAAFEERLSHDADLRHAYEIYEQLTADLRWVAGHATLRQRLLALDQRLDQRQSAVTRMRRRKRSTQKRWGILAAGALLLIAGVWLMTRSGIRSNDPWTRYYVPDPGLPEVTVQGDRRPLLAEAMRQYREGHFSTALGTLRRVPTDNIGQDTLLYYNGIFLLRENQAAAARPFLRRVSQQSESPLAGRARYHLGMASWKEERVEEASRMLRDVAADSVNPYRRAAQHLLKDPIFHAD
ncbi:hypothetical protein [Hymenobacter sp. BT491]|uniref:hypothetical protein n=1 Tax=Hymenobacter sp. BT491 TaxID=2766779 RepID=UPI0016535C8B|nr:hypothetical protein [Hymenobacter sp. BT491]MBC6991823.1 hypothetical protein [Hymenobacter sp. BT491]